MEVIGLIEVTSGWSISLDKVARAIFQLHMSFLLADFDFDKNLCLVLINFQSSFLE